MATFRDWPRTLRPASYRGVGFFVEADSVETGRRLEVHEFPHADAPYVEDLGRRANVITVTAYVLSDNADAESRALRAACEAGGAASLSLPVDRFQAHCESCTRSFEKDRLGYIAFDLSFIRDGLSTSGPFPIGFAASLVTTLARSLTGVLQQAFAQSFRGLRVPGRVTDAAAGRVRDVAALVDATARTAPLAIARVPQLLADAAALYDAAPVLVRAGATGQSFGSTAFAATATSVSTDPLVAAVAELVAGVAQGLPRGEAMATLEPFLSYGAELAEPAPRAATPTQQRVRDNDAALAAVVRVSALRALCELAVTTTYRDRREAIQMRADVSEFLEAELGRLSGWRDHAVYTDLVALGGRCLAYLSQRIVDLAPVVTVESGVSMPSLWWAWRLYGDARRSGELVDRNGVVHASFMPLSFEALAP